ncbi:MULTISPECIES: hypothetical protein [unclassified Streptomyces]|jgi:hypothetical protein|uniref:hypothetical protein n=1 Tax=unclassified Streptomyces TaxID=2593676 RepID=UPI000FFF3257|nr:MULTISPECIES: hypothetical protein [unclassified Streptomyces]
MQAPAHERGFKPVNLVTNGITAGVTLFAVLLGGWLSTRNQDRLWRREHARQWRDIRLAVYRDFLTAYRAYIAFAREPNATISAVPHPERPGTTMPFFDEIGRPYVERMEATETAARFVSEWPTTVNAVDKLVDRARRIAAARATHDAGAIPLEEFQKLWAAEGEFLTAARRELGLSPLPQGATGLT